MTSNRTAARWLQAAMAIALLLPMFLSSFAVAASFKPYQLHPMPVWPQTWPDVAAVADVNGDGRRDAIVATTMTQQGVNPDNDWRLYLFLQTQSGALASPVRVSYATLDEEGDQSRGFRRATGIAAADLNADGIGDIVVGRRAGLSILYGTRSGAFAVQRVQNTTGASSGDAIAILDVNADGRLDIATQNETGGDAKWGITVYFRDAGGGFTTQRLMTTRSEGGVELKVGDMNGDRRPDLVLSWLQGLSNGVEIFLNDGNGWFEAGRYLPRPPTIRTTYTVAVGDFIGGDGLDDLVMGGADTDFNAGKLYLYQQVGKGQLGEPVLLQNGDVQDTADIPDSSIAFDADGDQRIDLLQIRSGGLLGYFEQRNWRLERERVFAGAYLTWSGNQPLAAGDINSDGCSDVVAANYNYGLVVWYGDGCSILVNGAQPLIPPKSTQTGSALQAAAATAGGGAIARAQLSDKDFPPTGNADTRRRWVVTVFLVTALLGLFRGWMPWRTVRP